MLRFIGLTLLLLCLCGAHARAAELPVFEPSQVLLDTQPSPAFADAGDRFGAQLVAFGSLLAVGVPDDEVNGVPRAGAVYLYRIAGGGRSWQLQQRLPNPNPSADAQFGRSVAFDGTHLVVDQAPALANHNAVTVSVFTDNGQSFVANGVLKLPITTAADGVGATAVAVAGNRIVVASGAERGVFTFQAEADGWKLETRVLPLETAAADGVALAMDGTRLMIGLPRVQQLFQLGVVDVYVRDAAGWAVRQRLGGTVTGGVDLIIGFGGDLALSGNRLLVGCGQCTTLGDGKRGAAFLFTADGSGFWQAQGQPLVDANGTAGAEFGASVTLAGQMAAIAAPLEKDVDGLEAGTVSVYDNVENRQLSQQLYPDYGERGGDSRRYGAGLAISAGRVVVGIPGYDHFDDSRTALASQTVTDMGQIDTYSTSGGLSYFSPMHLPDGRRGDEFGAHIAMDGGVAAVGVPGAFVEGLEQQGAVDVYERIGQQWRFRVRLAAPVDTANAGFGTRIAVQGNLIVVGAPDALDGRGLQTGLVFFYERDATGWHFKQILQPYVATLAQNGPEEGENIGSSLAFDPLNDHLFIGAPYAASGNGRVYEMERGPDGWALLHHLELATGADEDRFGASLIVDRDRLIVGAPGRDTAPLDNTGALVGFGRIATGWRQDFIEVPNPPTKNQRAGITLANGSDGGPGIYFAGAPYTEDMPHLMQLVATEGGARDVREVGTSFPGTGTNDQFGVSMSGAGNGIVAIGSPGLSETNRDGRVELLRSDGLVIQRGTLDSTLPRQGVQFGRSVAAAADAFTGDTYLFAGSILAPSGEPYSGMVEVFIGHAPPPQGDAIFRDGFE